MAMRWIALALALLALPAAAQDAARQPSPGPLGVPLFAAPAFFSEAATVAARAAAGRSAEVTAEIAGLRAKAPDSPLPDAIAAIAAAAAGDDAAAIESFGRALDLGFPEPGPLLATPPFQRLRDDPRMAALLTRPVTPPPAPAALPATVTTAVAPVEAANTAWLPGPMRLESLFVFPERPPRPRLLDARPDDSPETQQLARLAARGGAAGHYGDLYDNRDRGHSRLRVDRYPLLTAVAYGKEAVAAGVDYGLNEQMLFNAVTFGNSSTAYTARSFWRSLPRLALTRPGGAARQFDLYVRNQIYVYPEHRDHDPERGDLYPANTPYMLISQGSSGSDQPHLRAVALILAALRPDTKKFLRDTGLIAPTVQMLYRRHRKGIETDDDYLSGAAHPAVFEAEGIDYQRLVRAANALAPEAAPPMVRLSMLEETTSQAPPLPGGDQDEALFDTPGAIARVAHGLARDRRYVLSAQDTVDHNGNPLTFSWRVLRGEGVTATPLDPAGREAEIRVSWQGETPAPGRPDIASSRVDIGVFASNGIVYSAPSFFSLYFPPGQTREYAPDGRLLSVDYRKGLRPDDYVDPWLFPYRDWRDVFEYGDDGRLTGWRREQSGQPDRFFDAEGIPLSGPQGRRLANRPIEYELGPRRDRDGREVLTERPG